MNNHNQLPEQVQGAAPERGYEAFPPRVTRMEGQMDTSNDGGVGDQPTMVPHKNFYEKPPVSPTEAFAPETDEAREGLPTTGAEHAGGTALAGVGH